MSVLVYVLVFAYGFICAYLPVRRRYQVALLFVPALASALRLIFV